MTPSPPLPPEDLAHVLAHTRALWADARGGRFFITGGTGFFGVWLLESFAHANDVLQLEMSAVVLTRDPVAFARKAPHLTARPDLAFIQGNLHTFVFPAGRFDSVIHSAADTGVWTKGEPADGLMDSIVTGTQHLLDFTAGAQARNFLLVSSGALYGPQPPNLARIAEDYGGGPDPLLPGSAWAEGKRVAEHLCAVHAGRHGYALKIARGFAFVGPHLPLDAHFAVGNFLRDALRGGPVCVNGDGTPCRSYLYAADLAVWLWTILFRGPSGRAYNVGSDADLTIAALAGLIASTLGGGCAVIVAQSPVPGKPVSRYVPDVQRAKKELGLTVAIDLPAALARTSRWLRNA